MEPKVTFEWPPLESDPNIFNKYFTEIGLPALFSFGELLSLDYKELQVIDPPVYGVIAAIKRPKGRYCLEENVIDYKQVPFYMKQEGSLDNACGLIAALHVIGNNLESMHVDNSSILGEFYSTSKTLSDEERCKLLENSNSFKEKHSIFASEGQTAVPSTQDRVTHHYTAFVYSNGNVVELDGTLKGPVIIKKNALPEELVDDVCAELKRRLEIGVITENLSVLYLSLYSN
jgi:ubiquitin carboxyl-terminal hydrolase L3